MWACLPLLHQSAAKSKERRAQVTGSLEAQISGLEGQREGLAQHCRGLRQDCECLTGFTRDMGAQVRSIGCVRERNGILRSHGLSFTRAGKDEGCFETCITHHEFTRDRLSPRGSHRCYEIEWFWIVDIWDLDCSSHLNL